MNKCPRVTKRTFRVSRKWKALISHLYIHFRWLPSPRVYPCRKGGNVQLRSIKTLCCWVFNKEFHCGVLMSPFCCEYLYAISECYPTLVWRVWLVFPRQIFWEKWSEKAGDFTKGLTISIMVLWSMQTQNAKTLSWTSSWNTVTSKSPFASGLVNPNKKCLLGGPMSSTVWVSNSSRGITWKKLCNP